MIAQLIEEKDEDGLHIDYHFMIDGKESALLVDLEHEMTTVGIFRIGASRKPVEGMITAGMEKSCEWVDLTNTYNDYRVGYETRSLEDPDVCCELVRDVLAQGFTIDEIMNGVERIGIERIKNPRLLTEPQPECQEPDLFELVG